MAHIEVEIATFFKQNCGTLIKLSYREQLETTTLVQVIIIAWCMFIKLFREVDQESQPITVEIHEVIIS